MEYGGIPSIIKLCNDSESSIQENAVRTLYYLCQSIIILYF